MNGMPIKFQTEPLPTVPSILLQTDFQKICGGSEWWGITAHHALEGQWEFPRKHEKDLRRHKSYGYWCPEHESNV